MSLGWVKLKFFYRLGEMNSMWGLQRGVLSVDHSLIDPSLPGISFDLLTTSTLTTFSLKTPRTSLLPVDKSCSSIVQSTSCHRNQVKPRQGGSNEEYYSGIDSKLTKACQGTCMLELSPIPTGGEEVTTTELGTYDKSRSRYIRTRYILKIQK